MACRGDAGTAGSHKKLQSAQRGRRHRACGAVEEPRTNAQLQGFDLLTHRRFGDQADVAQFLAAGYAEAQVLELILAIAVKTISNYANHLAHTPLDAAFASRAWKDTRAAK